MSIYSKFLNNTAIVTAIVAAGLITIPIADASAQQRNKQKARIAKPSSAPKATVPRSSNRAVQRRGTIRSAISGRSNRGSSVATSARRNNMISSTPRTINRSAVRNRSNNTAINTNNRGNRSIVRNRGNSTIVRNTGRGSDGAVSRNRGVISSAILGNNNRNNNRTIIRNRNNNTVINNTARGNNRTIIRNRGNNNVVNVSRRGNRGVISSAILNNNDRRVRVVGNNRGYRNGYYRGYRNGYRRGNHSGAYLTGLVGGATLYSAFNSHHYYDNYYSGVSFSYGYGNPYYYGPSYYRSGYYGPSYYGTSYYYSPRYRYRPATRVVYVEQPVETVYQQMPASTDQYAGNQSAYQYQPQDAINENCLQVREYTTTIEIGGETVDAYGQACLMPDGSWKFGDPIAEPSFNE